MATWVKICGITNPGDARAVVDAGADAVGFIFVPSSKRRVAPDVAAAIAKTLPAHVARVGVFMDEQVTAIQRIRQQVGLTMVQLHGSESVDTARIFGNAVKVFRPGTPLARIMTYNDMLVMFDAAQGGSGQQADWAMARRVARLRPIVLAGGLKPDNVADAVRNVRPWGVDVASGVEAAPGRKDHDLVRAFVTAARSA